MRHVPCKAKKIAVLKGSAMVALLRNFSQVLLSRDVLVVGGLGLTSMLIQLANEWARPFS